MGRAYLKAIEYNCKKCGSNVAIIYENGPHLECRCEHCDAFLKFIKQNTLHNYKEVETEEKEEKVDLKLINFKLDLLLDHFGIKI